MLEKLVGTSVPRGCAGHSVVPSDGERWNQVAQGNLKALAAQLAVFFNGPPTGLTDISFDGAAQLKGLVDRALRDFHEAGLSTPEELKEPLRRRADDYLLLLLSHYGTQSPELWRELGRTLERAAEQLGALARAGRFIPSADQVGSFIDESMGRLCPERLSAVDSEMLDVWESARAPSPHNLLLMNQPPTVSLQKNRSDKVLAANATSKALELVKEFVRIKRGLDFHPINEGQVAIVIAARNEAANIEATLNRAVSSVPAGGEIFVVLNGCTDGGATEHVVRDWATAHPNARLCRPEYGGTGEEDARDGAIPVRLLVEEQGGKLRALCAVEPHLTSRSRLPEYVLQVDADTLVTAELVRRLMQTATAGSYTAVGGRIDFVPPENAQHSLTISAEAATFMHGTAAAQCLPGACTLSRTAAFLAGHRTLYEQTPHVMAEDGMYTAVLRTAGERTIVDPACLVQTIGNTDRELAMAQMRRWAAGGVQMNMIFGNDQLKELGLGSHALDADLPWGLVRWTSRFLSEADTPSEWVSRLTRTVESVPDGRHFNEMRALLVEEQMGEEDGAGTEFLWAPSRG